MIVMILILLKQVDEVGRSLRRKKLYASVVAITFKTSDFVSFSKQCSLEYPINSNDDIYDNVLKLLYKVWNFEKIRNVGIRVSNFSHERILQNDIFNNSISSIDKEKVQAVVDRIKDKYGSSIINPASLLNKK